MFDLSYKNMMKALLLLLLSSCWAFGVTHEVHPIFQALSLHGTDVGEKFDDEVIQARVSQFPAVVVGALPEGLIEQIAQPHQLPGPASYKVPEANLLVLCGITLDSEMTDAAFLCTFDLTNLKIPEKVELPVRTILSLAVQAVKDTLNTYYLEAKTTQKVAIKVTGLTEMNASLKNLATAFEAGK